jgi:hypothetical protein
LSGAAAADAPNNYWHPRAAAPFHSDHKKAHGVELQQFRDLVRLITSKAASPPCRRQQGPF